MLSRHVEVVNVFSSEPLEPNRKVGRIVDYVSKFPGVGDLIRGVAPSKGKSEREDR
jgi:hypothetical protein